MKIILVLLALLGQFNALAFNHTGFLKGGISTGLAELNSLGKKDFFMGAGFNTHAGYRWIDWEFQLSSYIYIAKMDPGMDFESNGERAQANGNLRNVSFTPMLKYLSKLAPRKSWKLYFSAGPMISLQSIKLKSFTRQDGVQAQNYKVTYQSYGAALAVGMEEITAFKQMHPVYLEIMYQIQRSHKSTLNDASSSKSVLTIQDEGTSKKTLNQMIILSFGMTVF